MQSNRVVLELLELEKRFEQGVKLSNEIDQKIITLQNTASESNDNDSNTSNYYSSSDDQSNTSNQSNTSEQEEEKEEEEEKDEEEKLNNVHKFNAEKIAAFIAKQTDKTFWELCDVLSPTDKNEISHTINNHISTLNLPDYPKNNDKESYLNYNDKFNTMIKNKDIIFASPRCEDMQHKVTKGEFFAGIYKWTLFNLDKTDNSFLKPYNIYPCVSMRDQVYHDVGLRVNLRKAIIGVYGGSFTDRRIKSYSRGAGMSRHQTQLVNLLKLSINPNDTNHVVILIDKAFKNNLQKDDSLTADDQYYIAHLQEMYLVSLMCSNVWDQHGINEAVQIILLSRIQKIFDIMKQKYPSKVYDIQKLNDMIEYGIKIRTRATGNAHAINMQTVKIMCEYSQARHFCAEFNMITPIGVVCDHSTCNTLPDAIKIKVNQRMGPRYPFTYGIRRRENKFWYQNGQKFTFQMLWVITHQKYIDKFKKLVENNWMIQNQIRTKDLPSWKQLNKSVGCDEILVSSGRNSPIRLVVQEFAKQNGYRLCNNGKKSNRLKKWLEKMTSIQK